MGQPAAELLPTLPSLENHVLEKLCAQDSLEPRYTPLYSRVLYKGSDPCGMFFHVQGPRLLKAYAVWTVEENRILFYDGMGRRFAETRLIEAPSLNGQECAVETSVG